MKGGIVKSEFVSQCWKGMASHAAPGAWGTRVLDHEAPALLQQEPSEDTLGSLRLLTAPARRGLKAPGPCLTLAPAPQPTPWQLIARSQ